MIRAETGVSGYFYIYIPEMHGWVLKYEPVVGTYGPPYNDQDAQWLHISWRGTQDDAVLSTLAKECKALYIVYRRDVSKLEIWSYDIARTVILLKSRETPPTV
jgi:hypothetical protein